jgi:peptidoglycan/LPS O-acetylase OafA/YrhL
VSGIDPAGKPGIAGLQTHGFRPEIQGLRAIAVLAVLVFHVWPEWLPGGYVGVDVFFVISGFLVTGVLLRQAETSGRIDILHFYSRRIKRLVPAATLVLFAVAVCVSILPVIRWEGTAAEIVASALYVENWWLAANAVDYLASDNAPSPLQHYWSLSVEEQYYIVWPLMLAGVGWARGAGRPWRVFFGRLVISVGLASITYSIWVTPRDPGVAYFATTTRAWELALGGALAVFAAWERWPEPLRRALGFVGAGMILVACMAYGTTTPFPGYQALLPTVGAALMIVSGASHRRLSMFSVLRSTPMQYVGDLSYSLYLWHWPVIIFYRELTGRQPELLDGLIIAVVALALAHQTKMLVEDVFRAPGVLARPRWKPFIFSTACIAGSLCSAAMIYRQAQVYDAPLTPAAPVAAERSGPVETALAGVRPSLSKVRKDVPAVYATGCHVGLKSDEPLACHIGSASPDAATLFVVGDSHAAQWAPAYEGIVETSRLNVESYTKAACLFAEVEVLGGRSSGAYDACTRWNEKVLQIIRDRRPEYVLVSQSRAYRALGVEDADANYPVIAAALARRWTILAELGIQVIVLADTPRPGSDVPECLSKAGATIEGCTLPLAKANGRPDPLYLAAESAGIKVIDMNDQLCPDASCRPVVADMLVWRDSHHVSATFAGYLRPILGSRVASSIAKGK